MARGSIVKRCALCRKPGVKCSSRKCPNKDVSYHIVYRINNKQKWELAGHNKKAAERLLAQRISDINNGTYFRPKDILFEEFSQIWLNNVPKPRVKLSTYRGYKSDINRHLIPAFGDKLLKEILQEDIEEFLSELLDSLNSKTVNNIRLTMLMIMDYARRRKYIVENPIADIRPFKVDHKEMDFLNPKEIRLVLKHAEEPFKTLLLTAILTGMRRGELLALQWGDIDWNSNSLFVRRALDWRYGKNAYREEENWPFTTPKTKNAIRAIVMSPRLKQALEIHKIYAPVNELDLVFSNAEGNPIDPENMVKREFYFTLSLAGLRRIRFHDLRHTYATILISQNENLKFIQSQLGHASVQTTIDRYGHLLPVNQLAIGSKIDEKIFGINKNESSVLQEINN